MGPVIMALALLLTALPVGLDNPPKLAPATNHRQAREHEVSRGQEHRKLRLEVTAYTHTGQPTASGKWPKRGMVAVDPEVIPLGARLYIPGYGWAVATDTGGDIQGRKLDLFMETRAEAIKWGRQSVVVTIDD